MSYEQRNISKKYVINLAASIGPLYRVAIGRIADCFPCERYHIRYKFFDFVVLSRLFLRLFLPSFSPIKGRLLWSDVDCTGSHALSRYYDFNLLISNPHLYSL